jgi:hypothetical protein
MTESIALRESIRARLSNLADQVNQILEIENPSPDKSADPWPSCFMEFEIDHPQWPQELCPFERQQRRTAIAIREAVHAEKEKDWKRHQELLDVLCSHINDQDALWQIDHHEGWSQLMLLARVEAEHAHDSEDDSSLHLALNYLLYALFYRPLLGYRLGSCHHCWRLYLKPLHGADSMYERKACSQKAYRERKSKSHKHHEHQQAS